MPDDRYTIDPLFVSATMQSVKQAVSYLDDLGRRLENVAARAQANAYRCTTIWECLDEARELLEEASTEVAELEEDLNG